MANQTLVIDCSSLGVRNDFRSYISLLLTDGAVVNGTLLRQCKAQVCTALWGQGNPDISGVGMIVGYIMEHAIGVLLAGLTVAFSTWKRERARKLFTSLLDRFHDSAAFLCFAIQTAAIVVLIKEDSGISTAGMGDGSVRITEAVSVLTLLPLAYAVIILSRSDDSEISETREDTPLSTEQEMQEIKRFGITVICWLMAFYPFYSKMNNVFGPSEISNAPGSAIDNEQFDLIVEVCFDGVDAITPAEDTFMTALTILSYIPTTLLVLGRLVQLALRKHHRQSRLYKSISAWSKKALCLRWALFVFLGAIPLLGSGLIWTVLRVQHFQTQLAGRVGTGDADGQWTFGQVVAVTVFAPVVVDAWFRGREFGISRRKGSVDGTVVSVQSSKATGSMKG